MFVVVALSVIKSGRKGIQQYRTVLSANNQTVHRIAEWGSCRLCVFFSLTDVGMLGANKRLRPMERVTGVLKRLPPLFPPFPISPLRLFLDASATNRRGNLGVGVGV